jgi:DNA-binding FadR family transcriptional regulator
MEEMVFLKKHFNRERWIEVDMAWHEHIYMMSANPFLTSLPLYSIRCTTPTLPLLHKTKW